MNNDFAAIWRAVLGELEVSLSKPNFVTWFRDTSLLSLSGASAEVSVPSAFAKEWLEAKFSNDILAALKKHAPDLSSVSFRVGGLTPLPREIPASKVLPTVRRRDDHLSPTHTFDNYIVGTSNRLAQAAAVAVAKNPGTTHNPLFIYGGVGLGKTHLLQAIGNEIIGASPPLSVRYASCERFTSDFIQAIRGGNIEKFKKDYRGADVLLVDDIEFLAAKEGTQEEFFHTFNALREKNRQIVLTSDRAPKNIPQLIDRLSSRFAWGLVVDIGPPNFEMRSAILREKAGKLGLSLDEASINRIAEVVASNIRELEGTLNRIKSYCELSGVSPDLSITNEALTQVFGRPDKANLSVEKILSAVSGYFAIGLDQLLSARRTRDLVVPRQIAMYLLRSEAGLSYPRIAEEMGGKDHTTIMHGVRKVEEKKKQDETVGRQVAALKELLYQA
jgi:chromosomal replication initiator protein